MKNAVINWFRDVIKPVPPKPGEAPKKHCKLLSAGGCSEQWDEVNKDHKMFKNNVRLEPNSIFDQTEKP